MTFSDAPIILSQYARLHGGCWASRAGECGRGHPHEQGRMGRSDEKLMQLTTANEWKERSYGPANRRGGAEAARAAGRRMDPRGQAARRAAVAGRGTGHNRMA